MTNDNRGPEILDISRGPMGGPLEPRQWLPSTIAAPLAVSFAQIGHKVLLIDADLRRPTVHRHFSLTGASGLSDILTGAMSWRGALLRIEPHQLYVIPAGPVSRRASDLIGPGIADLLEPLPAGSIS